MKFKQRIGLKQENESDFSLIISRLERLEKKVFKTTTRNPTTLYQQLLIMKHLGMLDTIRELDTTGKNKAELLSWLLNSDPSNTKKALEDIFRTKNNQFKTSFNYEFLTNLFEELELDDLADETRKVLHELEK